MKKFLLLWDTYSSKKKRVFIVFSFFFSVSLLLLLPQMRQIVIVFAEIIKRKDLNDNYLLSLLFRYAITSCLIFFLSLVFITFFMTNEKKLIYKQLSLSFILVFSFISFLVVALDKPWVIGECDDYMIPTISLQNRLSLFVTSEDIKQAQKDFPDFSNHFLEGKPGILLKTEKEGVYLPWYFGTYSFAVLPVKIILQVLNLNQGYAFAITNAILYIIALLFVFFRLRKPPYTIFFTILLLAINPAWLYLRWPSAEVFIFSFLILSMVCLCNQEYKKSAVFLSIAATLNIVILGMGLFIFIIYFLQICKPFNKNIFIVIKNNIKQLLYMSLCFIPAVIPIIFNFFVFHAPVAMAGMGTLENIWGRFFAYVFDLNLGFLGFHPVLVFLFLCIFLFTLFKKEVNIICLCLGFFLTIFGYSLISHINSGMTGVARYVAWSSAFMVFIVVMGGEHITKRRVKYFYVGLLFVSVISTGIITYDIYFHPTSYMEMNRQARFVLDNFSLIYNPYPYTFVSRIDHVDGGYYYKQPVVYVTEDGYVTKILVNSNPVNRIDTVIFSDNLIAKEKIKQELNCSRQGFHYINFNKQDQVYLKSSILTDNFSVSIFEEKKEYFFSSSKNVEIPIKLKNNSDNWYDTQKKFFLSYHLLDENLKTIKWDNIRTRISLPAFYEETYLLKVELPKEAGIYFLQVDLVYEHNFWFSEKSYNSPYYIKILCEY